VDDIAGRILNPVILLTMAAAGAIGYARVLWAANLRPTAVLWILATAPGAIFLATVWVIRTLQGTPSLIWPALLVDWLVFSTAAFITVIVARRRHP